MYQEKGKKSNIDKYPNPDFCRQRHISGILHAFLVTPSRFAVKNLPAPFQSCAVRK